MNLRQYPPSFERWMITVTIMLVAILEVMDMTIVNVSLPALLLISMLGFTIASALCGAANNLMEIVIFRALGGYITDFASWRWIIWF